MPRNNEFIFLFKKDRKFRVREYEVFSFLKNETKVPFSIFTKGINSSRLNWPSAGIPTTFSFVACL